MTDSDPAIQTIDQFIDKNAVDKTNTAWRTALKQPPKASFTAGKTYYWDLTTNKGKVRAKLLPDVAPMHVSSTIYLTRLGFYDDLKFHRVIIDFMAQGGCPLGKGSGGPGYEYGGEFSDNVRHTKKGLLSMANRGEGTDGSQFFLTFKATPWLDGKHTIFGEVVEGFETLDALENCGSSSGTPSMDLVLEKATIVVE